MHGTSVSGRGTAGMCEEGQWAQYGAGGGFLGPLSGLELGWNLRLSRCPRASLPLRPAHRPNDE